MKLKVIGITGLVFLVLNQILLLKGNEFIQTQQPIDYAHWLLLLGVLFSLSLNHVFSDNMFSNTATILTSIGVIALVGQATIDFLWWSYGTDYAGMENLTRQIMSKPSIRIPFVTIGPALLYIGLAVHASKLIKKQPVGVILVFLSLILNALGSFAFDNRLLVIVGHILFALGISLLILRKEVDSLK